MKRLVIFVLTLMLVLSLSVSAFAVTPSYKIPNLPKVPDISTSVQVTLPSNFWSNWFSNHPITVPSLTFSGK